MNPYEVLQVSHNADAEVIRAAYRSLIQRFHPDRQPNNPQMAERVAQITRAYDLLSDPQRRAEYDSLRRRTDAEQRLAPQRHASSRHQLSTRSFDLSNFSLIPRASWLLIALGFLIIAWGAGLGVKTFGSVYVSPVTELSQLRTRIESPVTNESEKRQMYARKQTILQASPELSLKDNQLRLDDLAGRSVSLLKAAISEDFVVRLSGNSATITVVIPEITLVLGSFDAQQLSEQINKHRKQI
ncbi:MAG: J domain-containing protein, partial [Brachymonas sp.]